MHLSAEERQEGREHWLNCGLPAAAAAAAPNGSLVGENSWTLSRPMSSYWILMHVKIQRPWIPAVSTEPQASLYLEIQSRV